MQKAVVAFLLGVMLAGVGWFFIGRNDIGKIRAAYAGVDGDFQNLRRNVDQLSNDADGFAGDIAGITDTSKRIGDRSNSISKRLTDIDGTVVTVIGKVDQLEEWNRQSIRLGRNLGVVTAELRQINRGGAPPK